MFDAAEDWEGTQLIQKKAMEAADGYLIPKVYLIVCTPSTFGYGGGYGDRSVPYLVRTCISWFPEVKFDYFFCCEHISCGFQMMENSTTRLYLYATDGDISVTTWDNYCHHVANLDICLTSVWISFHSINLHNCHS